MHGDQTFNSSTEALAHLREHINAGDSVPNYAIKRLRKEATEEKLCQK